jgi:hypothetical protein
VCGAALVCLLVVAPGPGGEVEPAFPKTWHGVWVGQLKVHGPKGKVFERPWELHVEPVRGGKAYSWRILSAIGDKKSVRNYELVPEPGAPGRFKIDEKNGIVLNARLAGDTLYSYYRDGDVLISTRFERRGDRLFVELESVDLKGPRVSDLKAAGIVIHSYQLGSVQSGELRRKTPKE